MGLLTSRRRGTRSERMEGGREEIRGGGKGKGGLYRLVARPTDSSKSQTSIEISAR